MSAEEDLEARLAEAQKQREAFRAQHANERRLQELKDSVEAEERALEDEQALHELEQKHGRVGRRIAYVDTRLGRIVVKAATGSTVRKFLDENSDPDNLKMENVRDFVRPQLVYPSRDRFDEIAEELPAIIVKLMSKLLELAGATKEDAKGKS